MLQRAKSAGTIEEQQAPSRNGNREHLELENDIGRVEAGHTHEEENAGDDIDDESSDPPRNESMQGRNRQLLEESEDAEIERAGRTDKQYQAKEIVLD